MTVRWCAYCQEFLGEIAPFENFEISHGICPQCAPKGLEPSEIDLARAKKLLGIQKRLLSEGRKEPQAADVEKLVDDAMAAGVKPIDILMCLVTPLLHQIGKKWELGETTVAEEHMYTAFCERILFLVESRRSGMAAPPSELDILMVNAPGNHHMLGVRISTLWLNSRGLRAKAIYPDIPPGDLPALLKTYAPRYVGISVALFEQVPGTVELVRAILACDMPKTPEILIGGFAVKAGKCPEIPGATLVQELEAFLLEAARRRAISAA